MLTSEELCKWGNRLRGGGFLLFVVVFIFWVFGEFDNLFALLIGLSSIAFMLQGHKIIRYSQNQENMKS